MKESERLWEIIENLSISIEMETGHDDNVRLIALYLSEVARQIALLREDAKPQYRETQPKDSIGE